jgi:hypothetical protein
MGQDTRINDFDRLEQYYKVLQPPSVKFKDLEAIVNRRTSSNLLPFDYRYDVYKMTEQSSLVPITIQISYKNLTFKEETSSGTGTKGYHATGRLEGQISRLSGKIVERIDDPIDLLIPAAQFSKDGVAVYQRVLNLPPGGPYRLFLALNDAKSNNTGTKDVRLDVKRFPEDNLSSSSLVLADLIDTFPARTVGAQFQIGSLKVRPSVKKEFRPEQDMNVFLQVYGLKLDQKTNKPSVTSEVLITRNGQEVHKITDALSEVAGAAQQMNFIKQIPLKDFKPGEYAIQVKIMDELAQTPLVTTDKFTIR